MELIGGIELPLWDAYGDPGPGLTLIPMKSAQLRTVLRQRPPSAQYHTGVGLMKSTDIYAQDHNEQAIFYVALGSTVDTGASTASVR